MRYMAKLLLPINSNLVCAPIIDSLRPVWLFRLSAKYLGFKGVLTNELHDFYRARDFFKLFLVRSDYEKAYLTKGLGVMELKIKKVPLHYRLDPIEMMPNKELFCFHASLLADKRKNVERLLLAAQKYKFKLVLAGDIRSSDELIWLNSFIDGYPNISYLGKLSDKDLFDNFRRAKVFALPSVNEGVGMVALEAATYGCEIVLTNIAAPKEYYNGMAHLVDPYSIDSIGQTIVNALNDKKKYQPKLREYIIDNYNESVCMTNLESALASIVAK